MYDLENGYVPAYHCAINTCIPGSLAGGNEQRKDYMNAEMDSPVKQATSSKSTHRKWNVLKHGVMWARKLRTAAGRQHCDSSKNDKTASSQNADANDPNQRSSRRIKRAIPGRSPTELRPQTLEGFENPGIQIAYEETAVDLEYADNIVLIFKEKKEQVFFDELTEVIMSLGMNFSPTKCKFMLVDVQSLNTPLTIQGEVLEVVERFTYLGSCISSDYSGADEVNARISKARAAFANLRHLWRQNGLSLNLKGHVYQATVRTVFLYECETWPVRAAELRRQSLSQNHSSRGLMSANP
ncbi:hypothetical protein T265_06091 [Opisthorchis viverrini]|uniref:Reverse transcriptase domain-containing protein n=1 Tax=Opisthorchis viverrini TaxID=6198 RepID=A0A075AEH7_OPIVI|nr:hypothetical protein T265_06091 [Opisthorchis viverrini]KER26729.1 hypothetical protein T265_06091 [Opisthorchis viverrini]